MSDLERTVSSVWGRMRVRMHLLLSVLAVYAVTPFSAPAAETPFSSGSTGADGALDLSAGDRSINLPDSGVFNFTTINVPPGRKLLFIPNRRNTPVTLLAQGDVVIAGTIELRVELTEQMAPPGGFAGGGAGEPGLGPGGGQPKGDVHGRWVGPASLVPLIGGSGAAGYFITGGYPKPGGAGGGAILIASSTATTVTGAIIANGIQLPEAYAGSGGAIRLVANKLTVSGQLYALGPAGNHGLIRLEAPLTSLMVTGTISPSPILAPINPVVQPVAIPSLRIVSIGGFPVPDYAGTRLDTIDLMLPRTLAEQVPVVIEGRNIPPGTHVSMSFRGSPSATYSSASLEGTLEQTAATVHVSNLDRLGPRQEPWTGLRFGVTYVFAFVTFDLPPPLSAFAGSGAERVHSVRLTATPTGQQVGFLNRRGTEVAPGRVSPTLRAIAALR